MVHGDGFMCAGSAGVLARVEAKMHKQFLTKVVGRLGPAPAESQELRILRSVRRWDGVRDHRRS